MDIVHITDLHFGAHNPALATNLRSWVETIGPHLVLATGDLVDSPRGKFFQEAVAYLKDLESLCKPAPSDKPDRPRLLVIPGNHDIWFHGMLPHRPWPWRPSYVPGTYAEAFSSPRKDCYFYPERVWVYGFDSAASRKLATGKIKEDELASFHLEYDRLSRQEELQFQDAFKIVIVHHHPLPVSWQTDWKQQFLTMINSGSFLASMLNRKIDLVLHGHEHLQGQSRLKSSLGHRENTELSVISLGATLRRVGTGLHNYFNLIRILPDEEIAITTFEANETSFYPLAEKYVLRSVDEVMAANFTKKRRTEGYHYDQVNSITLLTADGDCERIVDYEGLHISGPCERAKQHPVRIPPTSGHIIPPEVEPLSGGNCPGIYIEEPAPVQKTQTLDITIRYSKGGELPLGSTVSYRCFWEALNSFAMNGQQFGWKYPKDQSLMEFTHFPVLDPISELTVVVQFPPRLVVDPAIRVTEVDLRKLDNRDWKRRTDLEEDLKEKRALRIVESRRIASLRVTVPQTDLCYGIEWKVPEVHSEMDPMVYQVQRRVLEMEDGVRRTRLAPILAKLAQMTRVELLLGLGGPLWVSLMIWNEAVKQLQVVGAIKINKDETVQEWDLRLDLDYGEGIAGRVFKTNEMRFYVNPFDQSREARLYKQAEGELPDAVLLSLPLRSPKYKSHIYGVVNLSSPEAFESPLDLVGMPMGPSRDSIQYFSLALDKGVLDQLRKLTKAEI